MTEPRLNRLVCVVEGKGEVEAIPNLCSRILLELGVHDWFVDPAPIRQSRGHLVDARVRSPMRPAKDGTFDHAVQVALRRRADAVLVVCDSDDDCPAIWGPSALQKLTTICRGAAVMAQREYESWLLHGVPLARDLEPDLIDNRRDAKKLLRESYPRYLPSTHQLALTRELDIRRCWARSDSFDKLVRSIASLTGATAPERPRL